MRLLIEQDNGAIVEVKEIEGVGEASNTLIVMCNAHLKSNDAERIADGITKVTGKRCIILPPYITKIVGV